MKRIHIVIIVFLVILASASIGLNVSVQQRENGERASMWNDFVGEVALSNHFVRQYGVNYGAASIAYAAKDLQMIAQSKSPAMAIADKLSYAAKIFEHPSSFSRSELRDAMKYISYLSKTTSTLHQIPSNSTFSTLNNAAPGSLNYGSSTWN